MDDGGLLVTLYDEETLKLYLDNGVYGQHMSPEPGEPSSYSSHYPTLADYGCAREGTHVFFFRNREICYGGQVVGSDEYAAFYLNGQRSPMGRAADAPLVWDESERERYDELENGLFLRDGDDDVDDAVCQPFLVRFEDERGLAGSCITSDQLHFKLGEYPYPLPANTMSGMGFCTMTPGETRHALRLLKKEPERQLNPESNEDLTLDEEPLPYAPEYGVDDVSEATPESHLEASVVANPSLLPELLRPEGATICRQVPISPLKPSGMDKADVCYFREDEIREGTIPNTVVELKKDRAGKGAALQVVRYLRWLHKRLGSEAEPIDIYVYAPSFTSTFNGYIPEKFSEQIQRVTFNGDRQTTLGD